MGNPVSVATRSLRAWLDGDTYRHLVVALGLVWGLCDTVSTYIVVLTHGIQHEANPIVRAALEIDLLLFIPLKLCAIGVAFAIAIKGRADIQSLRWWRQWFYFHLIVGAAVVVNNITVALILE